MDKVMMLGIDSLDPLLLQKFKNELPNFEKLIDSSPDIKLKSIFPPDTIPAWISIFTGKNPAEHGIVYAYDIFGSWKEVLKIESVIFRGKTFWDIASKKGKKVCVIFPHMIHPPWPVNGIMVTRSMHEKKIEKRPPWIVEREVRVHPEWVMEECGIPSAMNVVIGEHPGVEQLGEFVQHAINETINEAEIALRLAESFEWDLFFVFFGGLDIIQHFFWRYSDPNDPKHPPNNPYKDVIKDFYKLFDEIVGKFIDLYPEIGHIVFSDHGHGMRPPKTLNINEFLRKKGYLKPPQKKFIFLPKLIERLKRNLLDFVYEHELDYWIVKLGKSRFFSSFSKSVYMSSTTIDYNNSLAYLSSFIGPKSYSFGGIEINEKKLYDSKIDYKEFRNRLINEFSDFKHPETGEKLVKWAKTREEIYSGQNISRYPDIVFELIDGYGVYWGIYTPIIGVSYEHNLSSGGHKKEAVFLVSNSNKKKAKEAMTLMDIAPTILEFIDVRGNYNFDGCNIFEKDL